MPERLVECPHTPTCGPGLCSRRDMPPPMSGTSLPDLGAYSTHRLLELEQAQSHLAEAMRIAERFRPEGWTGWTPAGELLVHLADVRDVILGLADQEVVPRAAYDAVAVQLAAVLPVVRHIAGMVVPQLDAEYGLIPAQMILDAREALGDG